MIRGFPLHQDCMSRRGGGGEVRQERWAERSPLRVLIGRPEREGGTSGATAAAAGLI